MGVREVEDERIWVQLTEKENELLNWELVRVKKELLAISNLLREFTKMLEIETEENKDNFRGLIQEILSDVATISQIGHRTSNNQSGCADPRRCE